MKWLTWRAVGAIVFVTFVVYWFPVFQAMVLVMLYWILENTESLGKLIESQRT